ncbi:MAG: ribonuclease III [Firmicutes bacterium]|nr:ribonuclease III [Bacillota bacterium]
MEKEIANKNVLVLAFVGDAYMSLVIRKELAANGFKVAKLHDMASKIVCAKAQAELFDKIFEGLSDVEKDIANRARNASVNTVPSSCSLAEYKKATALESVIGFNVLTGNEKRAIDLIKI